MKQKINKTYLHNWRLDTDVQVVSDLGFVKILVVTDKYFLFSVCKYRKLI